MKKKLLVLCPYCSIENVFDISNQKWKNSIQEIATSMLAVRLGQHTSSYFSEQEWVEIGSIKDKISLNIMEIFNRTVGILRYPGKNIKLIWREPVCANCQTPFDVFINITPRVTIDKIWPHLTGLGIHNNKFEYYPVRRTFEKILDVLGQSFWGEAVFVFISAFLFVLFSFLPDYWIDKSLSRDVLADTFILRLSSAILFSFMVITLRVLGQKIRNSRDSLLGLINVSDMNSYVFWQNYMVARFAGADLNMAKPKIKLTQAALLGGLPSVAIFIITLLFNYLNTISREFLTELIFWLPIVYFTGITAWISMNFSVFMTENISKLSMKLTPLNEYSNVKPVRELIVISLIVFLPVAFLPISFVGARFIFQSQSFLIDGLLLPWFIFTFAIELLILSVADRAALFFGATFVVIVSLLSMTPVTVLGFSSSMILQIAFGIYWSLLVLYQLIRAFLPVRLILEKNKRDFICSIDIQLIELSKKLGTMKIGARNAGFSEEIERLLRIKQVALKAKTSIINFPSVISVLSPVFSSFLFPLLLDLAINTIKRNVIF